MKKVLAVCVLSNIMFSSGMLYAIEKVVYGTDGRKEVFETPTAYEELARSTAAMIPNSKLVKNGSSFRLNGVSTLGRDYNLCHSEEFLTQPTAANCSGFLVGPDTLVTAGHCVTDVSSCASSMWVFDYKLEKSNLVRTNFPSSDVYKCKSIVSRNVDRVTQNDFAVIKLDRSVVGRAPLKVRTSGKLDQSADLLVIGNPSGLPTKVTEGGTLRKNDNPIFFIANLDTFGGNSGSAVFDAKTGIVEGILVRGEADYVPSTLGCTVVKVCAEGSCRGEDVTRITNIKNVLKKIRKH